MPFNLPGVYLGLYALLFRPSLLRPTLIFEEFSDIPWHDLDRRIRDAEASRPVAAALRQSQLDARFVPVSRVCLDKDNCVAAAKAMAVHGPYNAAVSAMVAIYGRHRCLVVSNSSGTLMASEDPDGSGARQLAQAIDLPVLLHAKPKPGCGAEVLDYFRGRYADRAKLAAIPSPIGAENPEEGEKSDKDIANRDVDTRSIVVIGDRLSTDVLMANLNGMRSIWLSHGVSKRGNGLGGALERAWAALFLR